MSEREPETGDEEKGSRATWLGWLVNKAVNLTPERRREVTGDLFPEGSELRSYLYRFAILQSLSVLIATFGLISNSTAVVIGAMLVAPLMNPVLAVGAAMVSGWPVRQGTFFTVVVAASAGSMFLAWATTELLLPDSTPISAEILARTSPTLIDVGIALAAGAAGAYATVRKEVGGALPGVAVAVALVPPLATVGVTFALGRTDLAWGALLLYLTNLAGIVLIGALVFLLTGFAPKLQVIGEERRIKVGIIMAAVAVLAVSIPLGIQSWTGIKTNQATGVASERVQAWLKDTGLQETSIEVDGELVVVDIVGAEKPPPPGPLAEDLAKELGNAVEVNVQWTKQLETSAESQQP
ncbi:MAG: DUF389 domain-containing protein [Rubrobacteraceae bacterium]